MSSDSEEEFVYRVSTEEEWAELQRQGSTHGSDFDKDTKCIHLSKHSQLSFVLESFFAGRPDLYILKIDPSKLGEDLVYESVDGNNFFPHFYGPSRSFAPLPLDSILESKRVEFQSGKPLIPF